MPAGYQRIISQWYNNRKILGALRSAPSASLR